jgi:hypothetical protein
VVNVLNSPTFTLNSSEDILQTVHQLLQQQDSSDELFDRNLKAESSVNEKTLFNMQEKNKEEWNKGRFNIQRYFFHKLKEVFHLLFDVLHLSIFNNTIYSLAFFSHGDLFLNLLIFFPEKISKLLSEITKNIGKITFQDTRFSTKPRDDCFDLKKLIEKEGHLYRSKLLTFKNEFFELSNKFINDSYTNQARDKSINKGSKKSCIEFPHITE